MKAITKKELGRIIEGAHIPCESKKLYSTHPESDRLNKFEWDGMITIRFESKKYHKNNSYSRSERETIIRKIMNNLRSKWKLKNKHFLWVAAIEFGISNRAHAHILLSFSPLRKRSVNLPCISNLEKEVLECLGFLLKGPEERLKKPKERLSSFDVHWKPTSNNEGLVSYVCKVEPDRPYKEFLWQKEFATWKPDYDPEKLEEAWKGALNDAV